MRRNEENLYEIEKAIEKLKEENRSIPIIVEGEKDVKALHELDVRGEIITLHGSVSNLCDEIALKYKEVIILTDWDEEGWKLCRRIEENLRGRIKCNTDYRIIFSKIMNSRNVEGMPKFIKNLRKKVREKSEKIISK
ncbi:MAG: toprim domain-containing protein [Thermoplasmatales archaeon]|nr:toprim domain-containing protein [Thermoplasmatales archaeon]